MEKKGNLSHSLAIELLKTGEQWPSLCLHGGDGCESRELRTGRALETRIGLGAAASCPSGIMERLWVPSVSLGAPQCQEPDTHACLERENHAHKISYNKALRLSLHF